MGKQPEQANLWQLPGAERTLQRAVNRGTVEGRELGWGLLPGVLKCFNRRGVDG